MQAPPPGLREGIVVRLGPFATEFASWRERVASELVELQARGQKLVVVHSGGPRVDELLARLGKRPSFHEGHAVVDPDTFHVTEMVANAVGKDIVAAIQKHGGRALGISGRDAALLLARRAPGLGATGEVASADASGLRELLEDGFVAVVTAIGTDEEGGGVLLRADDAAAEIAEALRAQALVILDTDNGVWVHGQRMAQLGSKRADLLVAQQAVHAGLAATLVECAHAVEHGVGQARIVDVRQPGALVQAADPAADVGTLIRAQSQLEAVQAAGR